MDIERRNALLRKWAQDAITPDELAELEDMMADEPNPYYQVET